MCQPSGSSRSRRPPFARSGPNPPLRHRPRGATLMPVTLAGTRIMRLSRRHVLQATLASLVASKLKSPARAQRPAAVPAGETPVPIVFAHGNGDHAALWITNLWRFESNGFPRDRLLALNFTDPLARNDDAEAQAGRSSTADQLRELAAAVDAMRQRTGSPRVALVANSRGGYAVRNYIRNEI